MDYWKQVQAILRKRRLMGGHTGCRWIKSHPTVAHFAVYDIGRQDAVGNAAADALADRAAALARVGPGDGGRARWWAVALWSIQSRLLAIAKMDIRDGAAHRKALVLASKQAKEVRLQQLDSGVARTLTAALLQSRHRVVQFSVPGAALYCTSCCSSSAASGKFAWLASPCRGGAELASLRGPVQVGRRPVCIGGKLVHSSHELKVYSGLYFCCRCGHYGGSKLRDLKGPCSGFRLPGNQASRIERGLLPSNLARWPSLPSGRRAVALG